MGNNIIRPDRPAKAQNSSPARNVKLITAFLASLAILSSCVEPAVQAGQEKRETKTEPAVQAAYEAQKNGILSWNGEDIIPPYSGAPWIEVHGDAPYFSEDEKTTDVFESYSELDSFGRCGQAYANICQELMPTEEREQIGQVKPSGWHTVKYPERIKDLYLYNRCHLIGFQLAGENANERNLITGTRFLNIEGMLPFEDEIAGHVHESKHHVLYRVTPIFLDDDLVCRGVEMEASCIEDDGRTNGAGVCFHVFAYNIQPGIGIDYATGESWVESDQPESKETGTTSSRNEERNAEKQEYAVNVNTGKFHLPDCASAQKANPGNIKRWVCTREDLTGDGYSPCGVCNP